MFGLSKKERLLKWQETVCPELPNRLIMTEKQLKKYTDTLANSYINQLMDCQKLINTSVKPEVFFSRYDMALDRLNKLCALLPYVRLKGDNPYNIISIMRQNEQNCYYTFLVRYYEDTRSKAGKLKTEAGKQKKIEAFKQSLYPYWGRFSDENRVFIETRS